MAVTVRGVFLSVTVHLKNSFEPPGLCLSCSLFFLNHGSKISGKPVINHEQKHPLFAGVQPLTLTAVCLPEKGAGREGNITYSKTRRSMLCVDLVFFLF